MSLGVTERRSARSTSVNCDTPPPVSLASPPSVSITACVAVSSKASQVTIHKLEKVVAGEYSRGAFGERHSLQTGQQRYRFVAAVDRDSDGALVVCAPVVGGPNVERVGFPLVLSQGLCGGQ